MHNFALQHGQTTDHRFANPVRGPVLVEGIVLLLLQFLLHGIVMLTLLALRAIRPYIIRQNPDMIFQVHLQTRILSQHFALIE